MRILKYVALLSLLISLMLIVISIKQIENLICLIRGSGKHWKYLLLEICCI